MPPRTRVNRAIKRLHDLRAADFERFPVWRYTATGGREPGDISQRVQPRLKPLKITDPDDIRQRLGHAGLLVAADLIGPRGHTFPGFATPQHIGSSAPNPQSLSAMRKNAFEVFCFEPWALTPRGPIALWRWSKRFSRDEADALYKQLGTTAARFFPMTIRFRIPIPDCMHPFGVLPGLVAHDTEWRTAK
jgi:hypothetical protein